MRGKFKKDYWIIKFSKLFDPVYYLKQYPDVRRADIDPLEHFVLHGWKEGRNPNDWFNTREYLEKNSDVAQAGINPFVHRIKCGIHEGRDFGFESLSQMDFTKILEVIKKNPKLILKALEIIYKYRNFDVLKEKIRYKIEQEAKLKEKDIWHFKKILLDDSMIYRAKIDKILEKLEKPIDILIPVYNSKSLLIRCIDSVIKNTNIPYRLIICDDASTEEGIWEYLLDIKQEYENKGFNKGILVIRNQENLGFVKTVNKMFEFTENHFVVLNTDTEVPSEWLQRLIFPILENPNIASATPMTNACTIFSFPEMNVDNPLFEDLDVESIDKHFKYVISEYIEVPTGCGFCMAFNKKVCDEIGLFDEVFGKGYGEENDWSMRARKKGYINVVVPNLFVYHKHGGSFKSEEKKKLIENNLRILLQRFPDYEKLVRDFILSDPLKDFRNMVRFKILSEKYGSILIVDHIFGGGANYHREDLIKSNLMSILVTNDFKVRFIDRKYNKEFTYIFSDFEELLDYILKHFNVKEFIINELVGFDNIFDVINTLINLKNKYKNVLFSFKVHDFYSICPIYTLIDQNLQFCNVPEDINYCFECYKNNEIIDELIPNKKSIGIKEPEDLAEWRKSFSNLLEIVDKVGCFSLSSANILEKAYPHIKDKLIINPHKVKYIRKIQSKNCGDEKLRIAVIGAINTVKGGHVVYNLADYIQNNNSDIEIHLFGDITPKYLHKRIFYHGRYNREELPKIIEENCIDLIFIPSICPETFSYTTEEAIMMDIPVAVFNIGAPAERVREYRKGLILESTDPEYILKEITQFVSKVKSGTLE